MSLADKIDALLPQTQCTRCGYDGCRPYSEAIAGNQAPINQCPPGGAATIAALAQLLHRPTLPLNPDNGVEGPALVAVIDEERCIGCIKCLPPCPVDAIVGSRKQTHTVIAGMCTGCELCVAPCPVDCITMEPRGGEPEPTPEINRARYNAHNVRQARRTQEQAALLAARKQTARAPAREKTA
ncbi:MAG: RnfABCDGE type electron transport complex subunit B [Proteobacteria bacterium]|nr:RnfABCDGE type electron transport complex subunit B [Pseudomonadota bacterium]